MNRSERQILHAWTNDFGIELSRFQIGQLDIYLDELCEWNKKINLTGLLTRNQIIQELLLDSMIPSAFLPDHGRLLDVGSGAGFPGIPLIILQPKRTALFMEPNSKKVSFLKQIIRLTKLRQIDVVSGRIENTTGALHPKGYHIITTRALAHLPQVLGWCAPHLAPGGFLVNFQGSRFKDALEKGKDIIEAHRLALHKTIPYILPWKNSQRNILIFKKEKGAIQRKV